MLTEKLSHSTLVKPYFCTLLPNTVLKASFLRKLTEHSAPNDSPTFPVLSGELLSRYA